MAKLIETPWDSKVFGFKTYEIVNPTDAALRALSKKSGHITVKIDPLVSKKRLHKEGFYYCDTLIQPFCDAKNFVHHRDARAGISRSFSLKEILKISHGAFSHGRFHRDFNMDPKLADLRYDQWLKELYEIGGVFSLTYGKKLAGFFAHEKGKIFLHAVAPKFRGKGLAKFLWSVGCQELFRTGYKEISSSISISNAAAVNLYASLGFRFRKPLDAYHRLIP